MYICPIMVAIIHRHVIKLFLLDSCLSKMHAVESLVWTCFHCYWLSHMLSLFFLCRDEGSMLYSVFLCAVLVSDPPTSFSTSVLFSLYFECSGFIHYCDIFLWLFPSIHLCCPFYWVFLVNITLMRCMTAIRNANVYRTVAFASVYISIFFLSIVYLVCLVSLWC